MLRRRGLRLALGLGFAERRRTFAIAAALGARRGHLGAFVWGESMFVTGAGTLLGAGIAAVLSIMLVDVLTACSTRRRMC